MPVQDSILVPADDPADIAALQRTLLWLMNDNGILPKNYRLGDYEGEGIYTINIGWNMDELWQVAVDKHDPKYQYPLAMDEALIWQMLGCFPLSIMKLLAQEFRKDPAVEYEWYKRITKGEPPPEYPPLLSDYCAIKYRELQEGSAMA